MTKSNETQATSPARARAEAPAAEWLDPRRLSPWKGNPRQNDDAVAKVAESIERYGFGAPIVARRANLEIIAGHTRHKAALNLRLDRVPVRLLDLTEEQAHALALADNKLGELAEWDDEMLRAALSGLAELPPGFDESESEESEEIEPEEIDVSEIKDEFYLSVRGPVPLQPDALERLRAVLEELPGITVELGIVG